ncbi:sugar transferase [Phaeobacter sp. QD34_3]
MQSARSRFESKRAIDIVLSSILILMLAPFFAVAAACVRLDSKGPILFRQTRIGQNGIPFTILKFRTMHIDAEARLEALRAISDRQGICFKSHEDPRVTRLGRILRRFSIDELPQIFNVLIGDMSLVGPRPALPSEVAAYPAAAIERLKARPGITGLWQVSGRADIGFDKMVDMDVAYGPRFQPIAPPLGRRAAQKPGLLARGPCHRPVWRCPFALCPLSPQNCQVLMGCCGLRRPPA